jgi:hypothetical protein
MIYVPVDVRYPIVCGKPTISVQHGLTNNMPEIVFQVFDKCKFVDFGDEVELAAAVTNTEMESVLFTGELEVLNPHRGQILVRLAEKDFTMAGMNILTIRVHCKDFDFSFQKTIYVESINENLLNLLVKGE